MKIADLRRALPDWAWEVDRYAGRKRAYAGRRGADRVRVAVVAGGIQACAGWETVTAPTATEAVASALDSVRRAEKERSEFEQVTGARPCDARGRGLWLLLGLRVRQSPEGWWVVEMPGPPRLAATWRDALRDLAQWHEQRAAEVREMAAGVLL